MLDPSHNADHGAYLQQIRRLPRPLHQQGRFWTAVIVLGMVTTCTIQESRRPAPEPQAAQPFTADQQEAARQFMALAINLNGELCGQVIRVTPGAQAGFYDITCARYRDGAGQATYQLDTRTGQIR